MAHQVPLATPWRGLKKLSKMAVLAIEEVIGDVPRQQLSSIPLLLCVAEKERVGRLDGLDDRLLPDIESELGVRFSPQSGLVACGKLGAAFALEQARAMILDGGTPHVVIAAADSLLNWQTLSHFEQDDRLLTSRNSNGFMAGEGAGALLLGMAGQGALQLEGFGFGVESAHIGSEHPLRGNGLTTAVRSALHDARVDLHEIDYRIADISGEQYYFKEASLALNRLLRKRREDFELWHPAESIGETGALAGIACLAMGHAAAANAYAPGRRTVFHFSGDQGDRAAIVSLAV